MTIEILLKYKNNEWLDYDILSNNLNLNIVDIINCSELPWNKKIISLAITVLTNEVSCKVLPEPDVG